jgi:5-methylthioadenosine/S-adenosylhomocysteine deaminase
MLPLLRSPWLVAIGSMFLAACGQTGVPRQNPSSSSSTSTSGGGEGGSGAGGDASGGAGGGTGGSGGGSTSSSGGTGGGSTGGCDPSDASIVQQGATPSSAVLLKGTVVTPDQVFAGEVLVTGDTITCAAASCPAPDGAAIVDTKGLIFPGLIDAHNHILFDIFDEDDWAPTQSYKNHNQWTADARYKAMVDAKQYLNGESNSPYHGCEMDKYGELKGLIAGTTSILGAAIPTNKGCYGSLARTIDQKANDLPTDKIQTAVAVPSSGDSVCTNITTDKTDAYVVHVAEGVDQSALNEFAKLGSSTMTPGCLYAPETTIVHGLALGDPELSIMASEGMNLVWSPRSNSFLYSGGQITVEASAKIPLARDKGINIALGPDWSLGGSQNLLDELRFAEQVNQTLWAGEISKAELVRMVTINAAKALGLGAVLGRGRVHDPLGLASLVGVEEAAPGGAGLPVLEGLLVLERPAVIVVVGLAAEDEGVDQGVWKNSFWKRFIGPNHMKSPTLLAPLSPTLKPQLSPEMSAPTISMSRGSPTPRPSLCATLMNSRLIGSKPIILAATASMAT